ncbi:peptidyl-prolyl cis-trans isomerase C [Oxalobacteraceae bacterium GrIS 2.11]
MLIKSRVVLGSALALLALTACTPKEADKAATTAAPAASKEAVAATVNGTPISKKEVDLILKQQRGMPDTPETRKMIIDNIAMQLLVAQEAVKKGLDKTPDTLDEIEMAKQSVLAQAYVQDYIKTNTVTDDQLNAEYDKLKAQASGNQYKARHILVKTEDEAKAIIVKLNKDPKSFEAMAKAQSLDPGSKAKGGDLGWFDAKSMVPEFGAAVGKLEKGKFTETPVKTNFGYHVILLEDTRPSTASIPPLDQIKAGLSQQLQQQNLKKMLDDMKAKAKIDIVAVAPASAPAATMTPDATMAPAAAPAPASAPAAEPEKK